MGGNDSKPNTPAEQIQFDFPKDREDKFTGRKNGDPPFELGPIEKPANPKKNQKEKEKGSIIKPKTNRVVHKFKKSKQNGLKIKKTKERRWKPELQQFFCKMLRQSRTVLRSSPQKIEQRSSKPTVEYQPMKKGDIIPPHKKQQDLNPWDKLIAHHATSPSRKKLFDHTYISVNEKAKSSFKIEEIKKRLDDIKSGSEHTFSFPSLLEANDTLYDFYIN